MIRKLIILIAMTALFFGLFRCNENKNPGRWSDKKLEAWFRKGEWLNGWNVMPDNSIDRKILAVQYFKNRERWDKAFSFLKNSDLATLATGRHNIDGDNLYVSVTDYLTKNESEAGFEAHRKYADIQYVVKGKEIMQVAPLTNRDSIIQEYDANMDIEFFTVSQHKQLDAAPGRFFIFFPSDAHKPGLRYETPDSVRKVVVKIRIDK